jgi:subtilisin family serine protease
LGVRGAGIIVGESDSGVEWTHEELVDGYLGRDGDHDYHWFDPWYGSREPVDYGGHGTHTLGSVLGNRVGVAPDAEWIACANLTRNVGNPALYLACMQFMLAPFPLDGDPFADGDPTRGAHVLNNSWGCPPEYEGCDAESLRSAVAALEMAGVFVVASAGNSGPACSTVADPIAMFGEAFSVGALDEQGNLAPFSSRGPVRLDGSGRIKPDIAAPGVDVLSAYPNNSYELASGTSMAGPHVAGVVALLWSANPALLGDVAATRALLTRSATPFTGGIGGGGEPFAAEPATPVAVTPCVATEELATTPNTWAGYGIVNAYAAVSAAVAP